MTKERVNSCTPFKGRQGFNDISNRLWSTLSEWVVQVLDTLNAKLLVTSCLPSILGVEKAGGENAADRKIFVSEPEELF